MELSQPSSEVPLIKLRPIHTLTSPTGCSFDTNTYFVVSEKPRSILSLKMASAKRQSIVNYFPSSQKRYINKCKDSSPIKPLPKTNTIPATLPKKMDTVPKAESSNSLSPAPSIFYPATILPKFANSRTNRPTAENTGMPRGAIYKFLVRTRKCEVPTPKKIPPPPPPLRVYIEDDDDDDVVILGQYGHGSTTPLNRNIYKTPRKLKSGMGVGVPFYTTVPMSYGPQQPPPMQSKQENHLKLESTPPPEESTEYPVTQNNASSATISIVRRQLQFCSSEEENCDPIVKNGRQKSKTRSQGSRQIRITLTSIDARVAAYRKRMEISDVTLEEVGVFFDDQFQDDDNTKENINASEEEKGESTSQRNTVSPVTVTNLNPQRRQSSESISSSSASGSKRKSSADFGLSCSLMKVLKKRFGDDVKWKSPKQNESHVLSFEEMEPEHLAFLLQRYFLRVEVPDLSHPTTLETEDNLSFFNNGLQTVLDNKERCGIRSKTVRLLLESFQITHQQKSYPDANNCYWPVFLDLLRMLDQRVGRNRIKHGDKTLTFMELIVKLMEVNHQEYLDSTVKLHFPFIATLLQGTSDPKQQLCTLKRNFKELVKFILYYGDGEAKTKRFSIHMNLFNLVINHYWIFESSVQHFCTANQMAEFFWTGICGTTSDENNMMLPIIKRIRTSSFGRSICRRIIIDKLDELKNPVMKYSDAMIDCILKEIAQSHLVLERVRLDYDHGSRCDVDKFKGETGFHRACAKRYNLEHMSKKARKETSIENLHHLINSLSDGGDINATDNNGNTCLHDACQNGRYDAIELLAQRCWIPEEEPSRTNLDILAQDANGNTSLHIALSSLKEKLIAKPDEELIADKVEVVKRLVTMVEFSPKKKQILFETLNNKFESIFNFGVENNPMSDYISEFLAQIYTPREPSFTSGVRLSHETQAKIKNSVPLQNIFAYWEYFSKEVT